MDVLHISPHPDDESIAAPATLMALRDAGAHIVNFACFLGRESQVTRRRAEVEEACERARFELLVSEHPVLADAARGPGSPEERRLAAELDALLCERAFALVVGPSPHDRHPTHELVGRAVRMALERRTRKARWWLWKLWGESLPPNILVPWDERRLSEIRSALDAHAGELARNDYAELVASRGRVNRVLGAEQVLGFGGPGLAQPYAECLSEVLWEGARWRFGARRVLDARDPFPDWPGPDVDWWLRSPSVAERLARES